ncbi:hypothetical protein ACMFMG_009254 [Clarireedia jacksonii]
MANLLLVSGRRRAGSSASFRHGRFPGSMSMILCLLLCLVQASSQQQDPLNDFCRRWGHQTTVIDRQLFVDGGMVNWNPLSQNPQNYSNAWLLDYDLNTSPPERGVPQLYANLSKNSSIPEVSGGVLWADEVNKRFYLYGGDYFATAPTQLNLLSYDVVYNQWESFGQPSNGVTSVSYGMGVGISGLGQGYMLGGWQSNASVPGWSGPPLATSTLIKYDYSQGTWTNNTGPDNTGRAEGVMLYIPASRSGLLVYFGGIKTPYNNGTVTSVPMSEIHIYDIQSSQWYKQTATGDVPEDRRRFCAGATWAPDQSSYNIYLYGGAGFGANATGFDDVYILSLPSFKWIRWWTTSQPKPHNMLSCNVINGAQMIVIGGSFPGQQTNCDANNAWGTHNLDLGQQNPDKSMWNTYQPNLTSYVVPSAVISAVGGSPTGGATVVSPSAGFQANDLSVYFSQKATSPVRSPTRSLVTATATPSTNPGGSSKNLSPAVIAGIVVAVLVGIAGALAGCLCLLRHRRRKVHVPEVSSPIVPGVAHAKGTTPQRPERSYDPQNPHIAQQRKNSEYQQLLSQPDAVELSGTNSMLRNYPLYDDQKHDVMSRTKEEGGPIYTSNWRHPNSPPQHFSPTSPHSQLSIYQSLSSVPTELDGEDTIYNASPAPTYSAIGRVPTKKITPIHETYYSS